MPVKASRKRSLRSKITLIIVLTAVVLGSLAISISLSVYIDTTSERYVNLCTGIADMMTHIVPGDEIEGYLANGVETDAYKSIEAELIALQNSFPEITYMYVYKVMPETCVTVFDLDTPELTGCALGELVDHDPSFAKYRQALLAGQEIEPVISNESYGWLLTVYKPILDSNGVCRAYAGADVSMQEVRADRYVFAIRIASLLVGATIIIVAGVLFFVQRRIASPIDQLTYATEQFAFDDDKARESTSRTFAGLNIRTGDEIENLYHSISKMVSDVLSYISLVNEQAKLVRQKADTIQRMQDNVIISFANMIERRDACTGSHVLHTEKYVDAIGRALYEKHCYPDVLTAEYLANLPRSAPLHDVGKIAISDTILNKPGKLTPEEFEIIKTHTTAGREILSGTVGKLEGDNYLEQAMDMATYHHERWDGTGYPEHLSGEQIPICARIMAIADVFDALISQRSYKEPYDFDEAVAIIKSESGTHFDAIIVDAFLSILDEIKAISQEN